MAKTSRRSGGRTGKAGSRKRAARAAKKTGKARKVSAVPKARTVVALEAVVEDDTVDACDIDFTTGEATPDSELPLAKGGVATVRPAGRR